MAITTLSRDLLHQLSSVRTGFGRPAAAEKLALLRQCARCRIASPHALRTYHDQLLFHAAYPDDAAVRKLVEVELDRLAHAARELMANPDRAHALIDTGIAGTRIIASFTLDAIAALVRRFPHDLEMSWEHESEGLGEFLFARLPGVEAAGLIDEGLEPSQWISHARGESAPSDLAWLLQQIETLECSTAVRDLVFDKLQVYIDWTLHAEDTSRTFTRFPPRTTWYDRGPLRRRFSLSRVLARSPGPGRCLALRQARALIDAARSALAVRHRETDPVTYANPRDVTLFRLDRGIDIALFGAMPVRRLPVESFLGYVIARNRVPVAYGGGWVFFNRAAIGINVFESFRGGESAYLFAQVLRVYHHHFGVQRFEIDPFQFGADNRDGIQSGAFWFYYRLGFRPQDPDLASRAAEEFTRICADRSHRTPGRVLRQLTAAPLALDLATTDTSVPSTTALALSVTLDTATRHHGDRARAQTWARRRVRRSLGVQNLAAWTADERAAFDQLSRMIALIPDLDSWSAAQKRALVALMRAKGGVRERDFSRKLHQHPKLRTALTALAAASA